MVTSPFGLYDLFSSVALEELLEPFQTLSRQGAHRKSPAIDAPTPHRSICASVASLSSNPVHSDLDALIQQSHPEVDGRQSHKSYLELLGIPSGNGTVRALTPHGHVHSMTEKLDQYVRFVTYCPIAIPISRCKIPMKPKTLIGVGMSKSTWHLFRDEATATANLRSSVALHAGTKTHHFTSTFVRSNFDRCSRP
jgi:hypothetical protein